MRHPGHVRRGGRRFEFVTIKLEVTGPQYRRPIGPSLPGPYQKADSTREAHARSLSQSSRWFPYSSPSVYITTISSFPPALTAKHHPLPLGARIIPLCKSLLPDPAGSRLQLCARGRRAPTGRDSPPPARPHVDEHIPRTRALPPTALPPIADYTPTRTDYTHDTRTVSDVFALS